MRSGLWTWEAADPDPELELAFAHLRLVDEAEPENEMRIPLDPTELETADAHTLEGAAARPAVRLWLDRQGTLWTIWPPAPTSEATEGDRAREPSSGGRNLTFVAEEWSYETPTPRPLGELKGEELQELLDAEREAEAGVEEEWLEEEWLEEEW